MLGLGQLIVCGTETVDDVAREQWGVLIEADDAGVIRQVVAYVGGAAAGGAGAGTFLESISNARLYSAMANESCLAAPYRSARITWFSAS